MPQLDEYPFDILDVAALLRLTIRRKLADSVYVDCPFCQKRTGKMNLNFQKNVWRCNRCGEGGHMFELYAKMRGIPVAEAKLEIADALGGGMPVEMRDLPAAPPREKKKAVEQSPLAAPEEVDRTMRALMEMLSLTERHRKHLHEKRGLTDEQIRYLGLKSTASYKLRHTIPQKLMAQGFKVAGVPGFYMDKNGKWTVNFTTWTAGILIPVHGVNGLLLGAQIRLDVPFKDDPEDPEDEGTKYIWFSTSTKHTGASPGSPVNFIGDPHTRTVYVTEGALKAGIAHCLMNRTFLSIQGANNLGGLEEALALLRQNGTELIVEAHDMDKFNNESVAGGASKLYLLAKHCGLECRSLTWNPNYKGVDDWQLALKRKSKKAREDRKQNFKEQFLRGSCAVSSISDHIEAWHDGAGPGMELRDYLGLTPEEYDAYLQSDQALACLLEPQRRTQRFRVYQLDFTNGVPKPFAYKGLKGLHKAGYKQPPAAEYCLVHQGELLAPVEQTEHELLERIFDRYGDQLPDDYRGRSIAPSDVVELYDNDERRYYYRDTEAFVSVRFSPALAHPLRE